MSPTAGKMLVTKILPLISAAIARGSVRPVGSEDGDELVQDCLAAAASMLDSAETRGKKVTAGTLAFYALQRAKTGRRSTSASHMDALSPMAQVRRCVALQSLDAPTGQDAGDKEAPSLHEILAASGEDPAISAGRQIDWDELLAGMNGRRVEILRQTAEGHGVKDIARRLGVSPPRVVQMKREIGADIRACWGDEVLADVGREPAWKQGMRAMTESQACHALRAW